MKNTALGLMFVCALLIAGCGKSNEPTCETMRDDFEKFTIKNAESELKFDGGRSRDNLNGTYEYCKNKNENPEQGGQYAPAIKGYFSEDISVCNDDYLCRMAFAVGHQENCESYQDVLARETCYTQKAVKNDDKTYCNKIDNVSITDCEETADCYMCRDKCFMLVSGNLNDPSICEEISEDSIKNICYSWNAAISEDPSICENMTKESDISKCKEHVRSGDLDKGIF